MSNREIICSFCGKLPNEVKQIIAGPVVYICDECVLLCYDIIEEAKWEKRLRKKLAEKSVLKPSTTSLDKFNTFHGSVL